MEWITKEHSQSTGYVMVASLSPPSALLKGQWKMSYRFKEFTEWVIQHTFDGMNLDGGDVQDKAIEMGLLEERDVDPDDNDYGSSTLYFMKWK